MAPLELLWAEWESYKAGVSRAQPWQPAHLALLDACLRCLPDILQGGKAATEVLFPNSSMERVEGMYVASDCSGRLLDTESSQYAGRGLDRRA